MLQRSFYFLGVLGITTNLYSAELVGVVRNQTNKADKKITFNLTLRNDSQVLYQALGSTKAEEKVFHTDIDFSTVKISKITTFAAAQNGNRRSEIQYQSTDIENHGVLEIHTRERTFREPVVLSGVPFSGSFLSGYFDLGLWFDKLVVDGQLSGGCLDYNAFSGQYNLSNGIQFGNSKIQTLGKGPFHYSEEFVGSNGDLSIAMTFGNLIVEGIINLKQHDGTEAQFNLVIKNLNGSELELSSDPNTPSEADKSIQKLLAFFELISFDVLTNN
ncbi:MAG: hypothetical protein AB7F43_06020 [Bacteriovoracia bacterium]